MIKMIQRSPMNAVTPFPRTNTIIPAGRDPKLSAAAFDGPRER